MRPIDLDFQHKPVSSIPGWLLLGGGMLMAVLMLGAHHGIGNETETRNAELQRVDQQLQKRGLRQAPLSAGEEKARAASVAELRRITAQMNLPWDGLFAMLEAQSRKDVALLSLTPDARKGQLRISAEARDLPAMLAFHRDLEASDALSDVSLLNHEMVTEQAERPIRFNLLANWGVKDARP
ncbi:pilus assembly protein [Pseudomonas taiwanensis]|uniref:PilN domain-containing protein n=1 Tax=Pseudomonas taiwanensis TaxID=470150 RepID=UPI0015BDDAB5|nr:PilN domain-containing protein [Pseudomonas taiwanensis]NWL77605.1 pilus assembly protein [Pseudomonas taiwanensis]